MQRPRRCGLWTTPPLGAIILVPPSTSVLRLPPPPSRTRNENQLWKVLVRGRLHAVVIARDIRKAFLQVGIREDDRDALRFNWIETQHPERIRTLRFTRALLAWPGWSIQHRLNVCISK